MKRRTRGVDTGDMEVEEKRRGEKGDYDRKEEISLSVSRLNGNVMAIELCYKAVSSAIKTTSNKGDRNTDHRSQPTTWVNPIDVQTM